MIDPTLAAILALPTIGFGTIAVRWLWGLNPKNKFDRLYAKWSRETAGASFEEQQQEVTLRYAIVRLRRRVSVETLRDPSQYAAILDRLAAEEGNMMVTRDRALARRFMRWAASADAAEILYGDALDALYRWSKADAPKKQIIRQDDIAAFTTL